MSWRLVQGNTANDGWLFTYIGHQSVEVASEVEVLSTVVGRSENQKSKIRSLRFTLAIMPVV
jgi:hypothetical protein